MRRTDREVTDISEIIKIIEKCDVCRLALAQDNVPYIVPMNYGFKLNDDLLTLYFHCANEGKKLDIIANNPVSCFELDCSHNLIEADEACKYTMEYESVIGQGNIAFCISQQEKIKALEVLMQKYAKDKVFTFPPAILEAVTVFKLESNNFTAKRLLK